MYSQSTVTEKTVTVLTITDPMEYEELLPGTLRLYDEFGNPLATDNGLKKDGSVVLVPQPTDSPNDPLNWSLARKYWHGLVVCVITALTAATSNDAGAAQYNENLELGVSYNSFNTGSGILFLGIGYWTLLISPAAWLYGRRITYLVCMSLGLLGGVWFALGQNTNDALWNQLLVGASESCAEANVQLSLMDLFFQHQRGKVLGIYVLATSIGTFLGPLVASYIADSSLGWRWIGWFGAIISGAMIVVVFFGLEETFFDREKHLLEAVNTDGSRDLNHLSNRSLQEKDNGDPENTEIDLVERTSNEPDKKLSYRQRIAPITLAPNVRGTGFKQYFQRLFYTLQIFTFPAVLYSGLQWGAQDAWLTFYFTTEEDNWYDPPWNYSDAAVGNMCIPSLIGAVIGCFFGGWGSDVFVRWKTKRNGGIMEAEMRLWFMLPCALIFPTGMFLFGIGSNDGWSWPIPYLGLGFIGFGWGVAGDLSMSYLMDAYPEMVLEGMVGVSVINNTIGCIFSFVTSQWIASSGTQNAYIATGILSFAFMATTVPIMVWGKKFRWWTKARYERFLVLRDGI